MNSAAPGIYPADLAAVERSEIKVRRMGLDFPDEIREFWYDGDPFRTLMLSSLSATFPSGERFFIDAVRLFQPQITDERLQADIRAFIGQEANHSLEHVELNEFMQRKGYPMERIHQMTKGGLSWMQKKMSPERQLAHTAAIEHFTAIMAGAFLSHPEELESMDPHMAKIWAWHAIEESEHKAVAFDVYKQAVKSEWIRVSEMIMATFEFGFFSTLHFLQLLWQSGHMFDLKMWAKGLNHLWGKPGLFRKLIPAYLSYYRRDFHPWQHDNRAEVEAAKRTYLGDKA